MSEERLKLSTKWRIFGKLFLKTGHVTQKLSEIILDVLLRLTWCRMNAPNY